MNYSTSIAYNTRKGDFEEPKTFKLPTIKEGYIKAFAVASALCCSAIVMFLQSL